MAVDDSYSKALLHCDGVDESTTFVDESGRSWSNGAGYPCQISTARKLFGSGSLRPTAFGDGGFISTPITSDLLAAGDNFTLDLQVFCSSGADGASAPGQYWYLKQDSTHWVLFEYSWMSGSNYAFRFRVYDGTLQCDIASSSAPKIQDDAWHHLAFVRNGVYLKIYWEGSQVASGYASDWPALTGTLYVGASDGGLYTNVDEIRFSKGIARWTGNFTPPSEPYGPPGLTVIAEPFEAAGSMEAMGPAFVTAEPFEALSSMEAEQGSYPPVAITAAAFEGVASMDANISMAGLSIVAAPFEAVASLSVDRARADNRIIANLPALTMAATLESRSGRIKAYLPMLRLAMTGLSGSVGSIGARLPMLRIHSTGISGTVGQISAILPGLRLSLTGNTNTQGTILLTLPALHALLHGGQAYPVYRGIAMNPNLLGVTEYEQYPFNSFAFFNGFNLGAKNTGIHKLTGDKDNGVPIDAEIKLGKIPLELNKVRDVWIEGRADGHMRVSVSADEGTDSFFEEDYLLTVLGQDRATLPRGLKPVYIQIGVFNEDGADFDIDAIQIIGEAIERKKR